MTSGSGPRRIVETREEQRAGPERETLSLPVAPKNAATNLAFVTVSKVTVENPANPLYHRTITIVFAPAL
jgi:hypothetical protein